MSQFQTKWVHHIVALDLKYIKQNEFQNTYYMAEKLGEQINGLIKYLRANTKINSRKNKINELINLLIY